MAHLAVKPVNQISQIKFFLNYSKIHYNSLLSYFIITK